jgi:hypothetical protein
MLQLLAMVKSASHGALMKPWSRKLEDQVLKRENLILSSRVKRLVYMGM